MINTTNVDDYSVKELYELIVKLEKPIINFNKERYWDTEINDDSFSSICVTYKSHYNEIDCKEICLFERHFTDAYTLDISNETYEILLNKKWEYFKIF